MPNNFEMNIDADHFFPVSSTAVVKGVRSPLRSGWAFDDTLVETIRSRPFIMPSAYTGTGTLKVELFFWMTSATSGTCDWEVSLEAITPGDALDMESANSFDTPNSNSTTVPGTAKYLTSVVITMTNKDSVAAGDLCRLQIERDSDDATNDTATGDAFFHSLRIYEEV